MSRLARHRTAADRLPNRRCLKRFSKNDTALIFFAQRIRSASEYIHERQVLPARQGEAARHTHARKELIHEIEGKHPNIEREER